MLDCAPQRLRRVRRDDLTGQRFGAWQVAGFAHKNDRGELYWLCVCHCGARQPVRANVLRSGKSRSCGCAYRPGRPGTTWASWNTMLERCLNPKAADYHRYGGRGITVCARWQARYENFTDDMGPRPNGMTLGRRDVDGPYDRDNCLWLTPLALRRLRLATPTRRTRTAKLVQQDGPPHNSPQPWAA